MEIIFAVAAVLIYLYFLKRNLFNTSKKIGDVGENRVKLELSKLDSEYQIRNDVHLNGSQIDHMVFYNSTIFVIETKFWKCPIIGSYNSKNWTTAGRQMYNPVLQNKRHCSNVKKAYSLFNIVSVVVFAGGHNFPHYKNVIHVSELVKFIKEGSF